MRKGTLWNGGCLASMAICVALGHVGMAAQSEPSRTNSPLEDGRESLSKVTLEGFVLAPDGSPAEGAVVVSSAGGKAVTDVAGNYRLEVDVPLETTSVQVTAVSGAESALVACASVTLAGATHPTRVDPLTLSLGLCSPAWIPAFGQHPGPGAPVRALTVFDDGDGPALRWPLRAQSGFGVQGREPQA